MSGMFSCKVKYNTTSCRCSYLYNNLTGLLQMLGITPTNCDKRVSFELQQRALAKRFVLLVNYSTVLSFVSWHAVSHYCLVVSITNT